MAKDIFSIPKDLPKALGLKASSREPLPAAKKKAVRERARNTCEFRGCKQKTNLHFHHKNMKNDDNKLSNIELLCPNHHAKRHAEKRRKVVSRDLITGQKKTRFVKKAKKQKSKKKKKARKKYSDPFGLDSFKIPKFKF